MPVPEYHYENEVFFEDMKRVVQEWPIGHFELEEFDQLIGGIYRGRLTVLCAEPGLSKTSLFAQLADEAALAGFTSVFNTLEISKHQLIAKSLARYSNGMLNLTDISNAEKQDIVGQISDFYYEAIAPNMVFLDKPLNIQELSSVINDIKNNRDQQIALFVDYLQIMPSKDIKYSYDERLAVKENVMALKQLANLTDIPVFAISSVNRQNYEKASSLSALGGSSAIEYSADTVIYMNVPGRGDERETNMNKSVRPLELTTLKNRYGQRRTVNLSFDCAHAIFTSAHNN